MQDGMDFSIVVFIILAAFVGWRLYNVLGTRPDRDASRAPAKKMKLPGAQAEPEDNVISLGDHSKGAEHDISEPAEPINRWKGIAEQGTPLSRPTDVGVKPKPLLKAPNSLMKRLVWALLLVIGRC